MFVVFSVTQFQNKLFSMKIDYSEEQSSKTDYNAVKSVASAIQIIAYLTAFLTFGAISLMGGIFGNGIGSPIGIIISILISFIPLVILQAIAQVLFILREIALNTRK